MCRVEVTSIPGFVQQLAVSLVGRGYFFYVTGAIPDRKDPGGVDAKLISRYGIDISKWARARRKRTGYASLQYLRIGRFFVLIATHGRHAFFEEEPSIRDIRRTPLRIAGYSISYRGGHPHVRIENERYKELKCYYLDRSTHTTAEHLEHELGRLPFEPYAPVRRQLLCILRAVNGARKAAGLVPVSKYCLRFKRRIVHPFAPVRADDASLRFVRW